jgi:hypothetical protein
MTGRAGMVRRVPLGLFVFLPLLAGCKAIPDIAGVVSGGVAGGATGNPAIGFAVGVAVMRRPESLSVMSAARASRPSRTPLRRPPGN